MKNKVIDLEQKQNIKDFIRFLEQNKKEVQEYSHLNQFKQNMDDLYTSVINANYDSIEFDFPDNIEIRENGSNYYYSETSFTGINKISVISKNLDQFYFISNINDISYEIIKYYKNKKNKYLMYKKYKNFNTLYKGKKYKSLIRKPFNNNYF